MHSRLTLKQKYKENKFTVGRIRVSIDLRPSFAYLRAMKRPLPLLLFGYISGILGGSHFPLPLSYALAGIMGGSAFLVVCLYRSRKKTGLILSFLVFFLFGLLFIGRILYPDLPSHHLVHFADDKKYTVEGVLYRPPDPTGEKTRLYVRGERIYPGEASFPVSGNLLLTVRNGRCDLRYGDRVRFISRLYLPRAATNPGAFDYRRFLALQEIWVTAYAGTADEVVRMEEGKGSSFFHFVEKGREKIRRFLDENAPPHSKGIIKALL
jgi:competence protein ComEC